MQYKSGQQGEVFLFNCYSSRNARFMLFTQRKEYTGCCKKTKHGILQFIFYFYYANIRKRCLNLKKAYMTL